MDFGLIYDGEVGSGYVRVIYVCVCVCVCVCVRERERERESLRFDGFGKEERVKLIVCERDWFFKI